MLARLILIPFKAFCSASKFAIPPIIQSAFGVISTILGDSVVFLMILPYTNNEKGRLKAITAGILVLFPLLMLIVVRNLIVIGPVLIDHFTYPAHIASQLIPGTSIDPLVDVNLSLGGGFKVTVFLYAAAKTTAELFKLDSYEPLVSAFAVLFIVLAFWIVPDAITLTKWTGSIAGNVLTIPFHIVLPLTMLIISIIKRPKENKSH
ncbi:MAG TPA: GerAB/ArcD/ProY family transporter [Pseudobacteroides sp.]|uniref:GerAB/ArcD/ProY family transporter n=1 Tax=Pseudobacteroides sp. TaxID=1968840 RepID=UPI002F948F3A